MKVSTALRAPPALLKKIDDYGRRIERATGVAVTRSAAAHALIILGLRAAKAGRK